MKETVLPNKEYSSLNKGKHFPKIAPGVVFPEKGKIATGFRLSYVLYRKAEAVSQGGSWFNFPNPQSKHNGNTGTRQNLVGPDRALKQVRGTFPRPDFTER